MASLILPLTGVAIECLILFRGFQARMLRKYPFFYTYLGCVLFVDLLRDLVYLLYRGVPPDWYRNLYWATEFLTLLVGYGVILELIRGAFERYDGAARFARGAVISVFVLVFAYVAYNSAIVQDWSPASSVGELERDLRGVQALLIASVVAVAFYYGIRMGRNLGGIVLGYGFFTAATVMTLAVRSYAGPRFDHAWKAILPYTYLACLLIWAAALWSHRPNPPDQPLRLEGDYDALVVRTRGMLGSMRSLLERSARS